MSDSMTLSELFGLLQDALNDAQSSVDASVTNHPVLTESSFRFSMSLSSDTGELNGAIGETEGDLPVEMNVCFRRR
ncbi:hypothetical protein [Marinoscillum furvescens]|uniref:Uncharacterized protein n=1 Tax=Marinoscillum furvescens DSM 4134 TaxID=1122208 RepID=A0A3D9L8B9_MARFU|nr:hypothetical protein [Marinoscillum furvescens]REE01725.1 hypothetical protein C7460_103242 [Marinoscillum furvescens DSM 4134]